MEEEVRTHSKTGVKLSVTREGKGENRSSEMIGSSSSYVIF